jgi:hypothetical protein
VKDPTSENCGFIGGGYSEGRLVGSYWVTEDMLGVEGRREDCCGEREQREEAQDGKLHLLRSTSYK